MKKKTTYIKTTSKKKTVPIDAIQYVFPLGGTGWMVKNSKATKFTLITDSKREAVSVARNLAKTRHNELVIYGRDGNIEKRESYAVV